MTVHFITFGCKVNQCETENLERSFSERGFTLLDSESCADIFVVNTCTVTAVSDRKNRSAIRRLRRENPSAVIAVVGCFPQAFKEEARNLSEADIITGTKNKSALPSLAETFLREHERIVAIDDYNPGDTFELPDNHLDFSGGRLQHTRAFMKIQDGCNRFCSYCIIPYARGRIRSKPIDAIRSELSALSAAGYREVVLTGINLSFYGKEWGMTLADAVEACEQAKGIERIRLGSLEPELMTDSEIERLRSCKKLCPQFHLSLQSGCEKTLRDMNRHYSPEEYYSLAERLRSAFPNAAITTDIMVGFAGESEEDFKESMEFVKKCRFAKVHVFPYSVRPGTRAAEMGGQVSAEVKSRRAAKMTSAAEEGRREFLQNQVGTVAPVLFERENCTDFHHGYTPNYTLIKIPKKISSKSLRGEVFYVKIDRVCGDYCEGELLQSAAACTD